MQMENNNKQIEIKILADEMDGVETSAQNKLSSMQTENINKQKEVRVTLHANERDDVVTSRMQKSLKCLRSSNDKCCIYKVPEFVRKECYRPSVISIGPIFYNEPQLQTMQHLKWICLDSFLQHPNNACPNLYDYIKTVRERIQDIRDCYQEQKTISGDDFVEMIVLDAILLLCLFTFGDDKLADLVPKEIKVLVPYMYRDLLLEENQLPFFVVKAIFGIAFPTESASSLIDHTLRFIRHYNLLLSKQVEDQVMDTSDASNDIAHLLDLWWKCWCSTNAQDQPNSKIKVVLPMTAKELKAAGVKFTTNNSQNPFDIKFDKTTGELQIPMLSLGDETESIFPSILFFEQCHYLFKDRSCFADYIFFLDSLIDTVEDIQILKDNGILHNVLGSDEDAANFLNKIAKNMPAPPTFFNYTGVSKEVNGYANTSWNQWKAVLRRDYFKHPWAIISFIFAIILFVLTLLQAITGFTKN